MIKRFFVISLALVFPVAALARGSEGFPAIPEEVPASWHAAMAKDLPTGQSIAQTIVADLDGDGKPEWIALSEPNSKGKVWAHIFRPAEGKKGPERLWRQPILGERFTTVRGFLAEIRPFPTVLVLVAAEPFHNGDSRFRVQVIGWHRDAFRQMVPEDAEFRSQGGFTIEDALEPYPGDNILVWTYLRADDELLYDYHHYEFARFHFDGFRFAIQPEPDRTEKKQRDPAAAGKAAGATGPDLRRRLDRVAEVP